MDGTAGADVLPVIAAEFVIVVDVGIVDGGCVSSTENCRIALQWVHNVSSNNFHIIIKVNLNNEPSALLQKCLHKIEDKMTRS